LKKKGTFVDGHEQDDVEYRTTFLWRMVGLGFLNETNAPTEEAKMALINTGLDCPRPEVIEKTVVLFHDETTFQANNDQPALWAAKDMSHETHI